MKNSKFAALGLSVVLTLGLVACGSQTQEPKESQQGGSGSVTTSPAPAESAPSSGNSVTDDFLKTITAETADAKGVCGVDLTWYYQDNVLVIKGTGEMNDYSSSMYDNVAPWQADEDTKIYTQINWVIIDKGVTSIGSRAFYDCSAISKVTLPNTLEKIGADTFTCNIGSNHLREVIIPDSVTYIGESAFGSCYLETVTFEGDAPEGAKYIAYSMRERDDQGSVDNGVGTIYYKGSGFDELIGEFPQVNWVKQ